MAITHKNTNHTAQLEKREVETDFRLYLCLKQKPGDVLRNLIHMK